MYSSEIRLSCKILKQHNSSFFLDAVTQTLRSVTREEGRYRPNAMSVGRERIRYEDDFTRLCKSRLLLKVDVINDGGRIMGIMNTVLIVKGIVVKIL